MMVDPRAANTSDFSYDIFSGIVMIMLYPLHAAVIARPIPVFPEVGSIKVSPNYILPEI